MKEFFMNHKQAVIVVVHTAIILDLFASLYFQYDSHAKHHPMALIFE